MDIQDYIDTLILGQRRAERWYLVAAGITISIGVSLLIAPFVFRSGFTDESLKLILGLGGGFVATVSAFPAKEVVAIRNRIDLYRQFRRKLEACTPNEKKEIRVVVWAAVNRVATI